LGRSGFDSGRRVRASLGPIVMSMLRPKFTLRQVVGFALVALLCVLIVVPLPYLLGADDREAVVAETLDALLQRKLVDTPHGPGELSQKEFVIGKLGRIYFVNDVGVRDDLFLKAGLRPLPPDRKINVDGGDALVRFSFRDPGEHRTWNMRFAYIYGSTGGVFFVIKVYRSLWCRRVMFVLEGMA
jgi:hypothetical protein